jgi:hypothetical protein
MTIAPVSKSAGHFDKTERKANNSISFSIELRGIDRRLTPYIPAVQPDTSR